jgi:hypothetical protein
MHRLEKQPTGRKPISGLLGLRAPPEQPELEPIPFKLAPDGSFRIEDVPAGKYTLKLMVIAPPEKGRVDPNRTIAKAEKQVVVPAMASGRSDEPLDVGTIEMGPR